MARNKKPTWKDVKSILVEKEKSELLKLIADLYSSSAENRSFINARFSVGGQTLEPYRSIISESLYPDVYRNKPISLAKGKKAISDYFKATADFGDIDEQFYSSLELMFGNILDILRQKPTDIQKKYFTRLENVVSTAINIGWGYHDHISDILSQFEAEIESTC
jgi:hypothetical protein